MKTRVPVWRKSAQKSRSFGAFIRRRNKLLTVVGALIVFLTFITREVLRDNAKEWASRLEAGQEAYYIQSQIGDMGVQLGRIQFESHLIWQRLYGVNTAEIDETAQKSRMDFDSTRLEALVMRGRALIHGMAELEDADRIPAAKQAGAIVDIAAAQGDLISKLAQQGGGPQTTPSLTGIETKTAQLESELSNLGDGLLSKEQQQMFLYQDASEGLDEITYVLYAFGWGLALVARLYGDQNSDKGDIASA